MAEIFEEISCEEMFDVYYEDDLVILNDER